jgi:TRAP-type transport system periplasmic protein
MTNATKVMLVVFGLLLVFCVNCSDGIAQDKTIRLRFSTFMPPTHGIAKLTDEWCNEFAKRTDGRVSAKQYAAATLTSPAQTYDSTVKGAIDIGYVVISYTAGKFPLTEVLDYPIGHPNAAVSSRLANEYFAKFHPKEFDDVKVLFLHGTPPNILHTKKPVYKLEDLKGMKIRTTGVTARLIQALGGIPVAMPNNEVYDALSKGVVEGLIHTTESLETGKFAEVIKYTTETFAVATTSVFVVAMNKEKWNSIKPEDQKVIEQLNKEYAAKIGEAGLNFDKVGKEFSLSKGNKFITLSAAENARWVAASQPIFEDYVQRMKEKGLPGEEVLKFARDFIKKNPK